MKKRAPAAKTKLRKRAEAKVSKRSAPVEPDASMSRVVHELEVHQVELEMQNEELRSARRGTEAALERYTETFDFAPIGYATLDRAGTVLEINHAGARLLGLDRARFAGTPFHAFVTSAAVRSFDALLVTALSKASAMSCELDLLRDDTPVPVRMTAAVLRRAEATILLAFEDISERRAKEAELVHTEAQLREAIERKDEFLAILSHELRNPLSPIRTSVAVLQLAEPGSDAAKSAIDIIDRATSHLSRLVDDLLDVTRITRGKIQLRSEPVELVALVDNTVRDLRDEFARRRVSLDVERRADELWMHGDPARLVQILTNVLGNANKFTPAGGSVTISLDFEEPFATIRIRDTGVGIAPEVIRSLFVPFAQGPQALDRRQGGLGLGLAMVKSLVEMHGGRVAVNSAGFGHGTEVVVQLPAQRQRIQSDARAALPIIEPRRVLIIEDWVDTAHSLRNALVVRGHDVRIAYDGQSGIAQMRTFHPDVVLCDVGLPDMDGFALARLVSSDASLRDTYLVALTGYARPEDVAQALDAGFQRHLAKPPEIDELDRVLASAPARAPLPEKPDHLASR